MCGSPSNIHMDIIRIVREIEEDVKTMGYIDMNAAVGEVMADDTTYEDILATTVINKVRIARDNMDSLVTALVDCAGAGGMSVFHWTPAWGEEARGGREGEEVFRWR